MIKRAFDIILSSVGLAVTFPLLAVLAVLVKATSPGPAIYRGRRVGRGNRPFHILKFRSMVANAEQVGGSSTSADDARITKIGRIMRRYKLDELPQLWNVLRGDMSLVGPRPEVQEYVDLYTKEEKRILTLRPGITDWASIWNSDEGAILAGSDDPDRTYLEVIRPTKLQLQLKYWRECSLWTDIKILAYTIIKMVRKDWLPRELESYGRLRPPAAANESERRAA